MFSVRIKKLRTNYEVRFKYHKPLIDYLKTLPKDQHSTRMNPIVMEGFVINDWFHLINEAGIEKLIQYCKTNHIKYEFENLEAVQQQQLVEKSDVAKANVDYALNFKSSKIDISEIDFSFMKLPPYDYQKQAVIFSEQCGGKSLIGDSPGVGKSLVSIAFAIKNKLKTLIVCPASLKLNWRKEIMHFTNEKAFIYKYNPPKKNAEILFTKEESLFHIINYESLDSYIKINFSHKCQNYNCKHEWVDFVKNHKHCPECRAASTVKTRSGKAVFVEGKDGDQINIEDYQLIVLDEAHYISNMKSRRSQLIIKGCKDFKYKMLLTGTAIKNRPYEFFPLLHFLNPDEWKNAHAFGVKYCDGHENNFGWDYSGASHLDELYQRISPFFLRRNKSEVLKSLPPKTYSEIPIELSPEEAREYRKIEKGVVDESSESDNQAMHMARFHKLKQFTSDVKLKHAVKIIEDIINGDEKIVVFSQYLAVLHKLHEFFKENSVVFTGAQNMNEKQDAVDKFMKDPNCKVFIGSVHAASLGITLTSASTCLFIDLDYSPSVNLQAEDRIHRASSKSDKAHIIYLLCESTVDMDILSLLKDKDKIVSKVLDGKELNKKAERFDGSILENLINIILSKKEKKLF